MKLYLDSYFRQSMPAVSAMFWKTSELRLDSVSIELPVEMWGRVPILVRRK